MCQTQNVLSASTQSNAYEKTHLHSNAHSVYIIIAKTQIPTRNQISSANNWFPSPTNHPHHPSIIPQNHIIMNPTSPTSNTGYSRLKKSRADFHHYDKNRHPHPNTHTDNYIRTNAVHQTSSTYHAQNPPSSLRPNRREHHPHIISHPHSRRSLSLSRLSECRRTRRTALVHNV